MLAEQIEFYDAAEKYAELMMRDMRNANNKKEIQDRIEQARVRFFNSYLLWKPIRGPETKD